MKNKVEEKLESLQAKDPDLYEVIKGEQNEGDEYLNCKNAGKIFISNNKGYIYWDDKRWKEIFPNKIEEQTQQKQNPGNDQEEKKADEA